MNGDYREGNARWLDMLTGRLRTVDNRRAFYYPQVTTHRLRGICSQACKPASAMDNKVAMA